MPTSADRPSPRAGLLRPQPPPVPLLARAPAAADICRTCFIRVSTTPPTRNGPGHTSRHEPSLDGDTVVARIGAQLRPQAAQRLRQEHVKIAPQPVRVEAAGHDLDRPDGTGLH